MRRWCYQTFRTESYLEFIAMATADDIAANQEYVRLATECVEVPGGSNVNNYNNIEVIVATAVAVGAHAVWPGWGHASENPRFPQVSGPPPTLPPS